MNHTTNLKTQDYLDFGPTDDPKNYAFSENVEQQNVKISKIEIFAKEKINRNKSKERQSNYQKKYTLLPGPDNKSKEGYYFLNSRSKKVQKSSEIIINPRTRHNTT